MDSHGTHLNRHFDRELLAVDPEILVLADTPENLMSDDTQLDNRRSQ